MDGADNLNGAGELGGADGEGNPAGTGEGNPAGTGEGDTAGRAGGPDGSVRAVERDGSGWGTAAKGRGAWDWKPHVAQT